MISERCYGQLIKWNDDRGFGFIVPKGGGERVFVHIKAFSDLYRRPIGNEIVTYEVVADDQGRLRAERVEFDDNTTIPTQGWTIASTIALLFLLFVGVWVFVGQLSILILALYVIALFERRSRTVGVA